MILSRWFPPAQNAAQRQRQRGAMLLAGMGLALAMLAAPPMLAGFMLLPGDAIRFKMLDDNVLRPEPTRDNQLDAAETETLINNRQSVLAFWPAPALYDDLAMAYMARAELTGLEKTEGRKQLADVIHAQEQALIRNPANTFGWQRLAYARLLYNGPSRLVSEALEKAIESAPHESLLMSSRLALLVAVKPYWSNELRELFPEQVRIAYKTRKWQMMAAALAGDFVADLYAAVADDPAMIANLRGLERERRAWLKMSPKLTPLPPGIKEP
jgi:hypothetical protein